MELYNRLLNEARYAQQSYLDGYGASLLWECKGKKDMAYELGALNLEQARKLNDMTVVFYNTNGKRGKAD